MLTERHIEPEHQFGKAAAAPVPKPFNPDDVLLPSRTMVSYKAEVLGPTGWTSAQAISKQVQAKLDAFVAGGWRLAGMASAAGSGGFLGGATNPYLLLVFEHD